jgi:hypothetical protein
MTTPVPRFTASPGLPGNGNGVGDAGIPAPSASFGPPPGPDDIGGLPASPPGPDVFAPPAGPPGPAPGGAGPGPGPLPGPGGPPVPPVPGGPGGRGPRPPGRGRPPTGERPPGGRTPGQGRKPPAGRKPGQAKGKGKAPGRGPAQARTGGPPPRTGAQRSSQSNRARPRKPGLPGLAPVYDVDGPRIRLGVGWFVLALAGLAASPYSTVLVYGAAAALAARQIVTAWKSVSWQADMAAGLAVLPVLAAAFGTTPAVGALVLVVVVALGASFAPDGARLPGFGGRIAAAGILVSAAVPGIAAASMVLIRKESLASAVVLLVMASAYEVGDFIVGSGASNFVEGPLAGMATTILVAFPLTLVLIPPFDRAGAALLAFAAVACPIGQITASALLPRPGASASALRRIDTLLVLAPLWAAAAAAL